MSGTFGYELDPDRLAEQVIEGCEMPDGTYPGQMDLTGRVFTGASLMAAGFTLRPMRGDAPAAQLLFEQMDAEEMRYAIAAAVVSGRV